MLSIEGENNITFVPCAGLNPSKVEYRARIEYLVKTREGEELEAEAATASKKKTRARPHAEGKEGQEERHGRRAAGQGRLGG